MEKMHLNMLSVLMVQVSQSIEETTKLRDDMLKTADERKQSLGSNIVFLGDGGVRMLNDKLEEYHSAAHSLHAAWVALSKVQEDK